MVKKGSNVIRAVFPTGIPLKLKMPKKPKVNPHVSLKSTVYSRFPSEYINGPKQPTREERKRLPQWGLSQFAFDELQRKTPIRTGRSVWMSQDRWNSLSSSEREELRRATKIFSLKRRNLLLRLDLNLPCANEKSDEDLHSRNSQDIQFSASENNPSPPKPPWVDRQTVPHIQPTESSTVTSDKVLRPTAPDLYKKPPGRNSPVPRRINSNSEVVDLAQPLTISSFSPDRDSSADSSDSIRIHNSVSLSLNEGSDSSTVVGAIPTEFSCPRENLPTDSFYVDERSEEVFSSTHSIEQLCFKEMSSQASEECIAGDVSALEPYGIELSVPNGESRPPIKAAEIHQFKRDSAVKEWVLNNAHGVCECCSEPAPFKSADGQPYLEVHHLRRLADGGSDSVSNAVALCPNCHREIHYGQDSYQLMRQLYRCLKRLISE